MCLAHDEYRVNKCGDAASAHAANVLSDLGTSPAT